MALPLVPIAVLSLGTVVGYRKFKKKRGMTPERKKLFEQALRTMKEPDKLRKLADAFEKDGLRAEATELRKRATIREAPPEVKNARRDAFKKGMTSTDPAKVKALANEFHKHGYYGNAEKLRSYAAGLIDRAKAAVHMHGEDE